MKESNQRTSQRHTPRTQHTNHKHNHTMSAATTLRADLESDKHAISVSEFIKDRLFFVTFKNKTHRNTTDAHYFTVDEELVYQNYYGDFGPLNLAALAKYLTKVNYKLKSPSLTNKAIVHYTTPNEKKRVNAALLMGTYAIVHLQMTPIEAFNHLSSLHHPYISFQDASVGESQYKVRLIDCLNAIRKAIYFGLINFDDFNVDEYEKLESIKFGDINWIVPNKLLALSGPVDNPTEACYHAPEYYLDFFRQHNVTTIIRLNVKMYNSKAFTNAGLAHYELYFLDGGVPSAEIVTRFFEIVENASGAVAVHCKAGLGRTGCLIGAYLIKHYRMTALEAIAWMRMCRPGCVIGCQQSWLEEMEPTFWNMGDAFRSRYHGGTDRIPHHKYGIYSYHNHTDQDPQMEHYQSENSKSNSSQHQVEELSNSAYCKGSISFRNQIECTKDGKETIETQGDRLNQAKLFRDSILVGYKRKIPKAKLYK